jgi:hypothetical protein
MKKQNRYLMDTFFECIIKFKVIYPQLLRKGFEYFFHSPIEPPFSVLSCSVNPCGSCPAHVNTCRRVMDSGGELDADDIPIETKSSGAEATIATGLEAELGRRPFSASD